MIYAKLPSIAMCLSTPQFHSIQDSDDHDFEVMAMSYFHRCVDSQDDGRCLIPAVRP